MPQPVPPQSSDGLGLTRSELLPFRSTKVSLIHSRAFLPMLLTVAAFFYFIAAPFSTTAQIYAFINTLGTFLAVIIFLEIYYYSAINRSLLAYVPAALFVVIQLEVVPDPWFYVFHGLLGGETDNITESTSLFETIRIYFAGPGLMEEIIKAAPALIGLALARIALRRPDKPQNRVLAFFTLRGPLDGVLMGSAAGIGFLLAETLGQYVPNEVNDQLNGGADLATAMLFGIHLLIPRILNVVLGHSAWAGISGYFIGMAVRHPEARFRLVALGIVLAAILHALWDVWARSSAIVPMLIMGIISAVLFLSCLVKARQLNQVDYAGVTGSHSILAVSPSPHAPTPHAAAVAAPATPQRTSRLGRMIGGLERIVGVHAKPSQPAVQVPVGSAAAAAVDGTVVPSTTPDAPSAGTAAFSIGAGDQRFALTPDRSIDFSALFASLQVPPGCVGVVAPHPTIARVLGIRNVGSASWIATASGGEVQTVAPSRTLKVEAGTRIAFGSATVDIALV